MTQVEPHPPRSAGPGAPSGARAGGPGGARGPSAEQESTPAAREALVRRWLSRLHGLALALTARAHEAEDLTQEAFTRALAAPRLPREPEAEGAWLRTILRHAFVDRLRRRRVEARAGPAPGRAGDAPPPDDPVERAEASLARLPEDERLVCWLRLVAELPFREIAELLSTSKSSVDRTFRRALARLRGEESP